MSDLTAHWRKFYQNTFLGAWDLYDAKTGQYREIKARIDRVTQEEVIGEGGRRTTPILLYLSGRKGPVATPMIVSKTSGKTLEIMFGEAPARWVGNEISIYVRKDKRVRAGTGSVLVIRNTRAGQALKDELRQQAPPPPDPADFDDAPPPEKGPDDAQQ